MGFKATTLSSLLLALAVISVSAGDQTGVCGNLKPLGTTPVTCETIDGRRFRSATASADYYTCVCRACGLVAEQIDAARKSNSGFLHECAAPFEDPSNRFDALRNIYAGDKPEVETSDEQVPDEKVAPERMGSADVLPVPDNELRDPEFAKAFQDEEVKFDDDALDSGADENSERENIPEGPSDVRTVAMKHPHSGLRGGPLVNRQVAIRMIKANYPNMIRTLLYDAVEVEQDDTIEHPYMEDPDTPGMMSPEVMTELHSFLYQLGYSFDSPHKPMKFISSSYLPVILRRPGPRAITLPQDEGTEPTSDGLDDEALDHTDNTAGTIVSVNELQHIWFLNTRAYTAPDSHIPDFHRVRPDDERDKTFGPGMYMKSKHYGSAPLEMVGDNNVNTFFKGKVRKHLPFVRATTWRDTKTNDIFVTFRGSENFLAPMMKMFRDLCRCAVSKFPQNVAATIQSMIVGVENAFHRTFLRQELLDCPDTIIPGNSKRVTKSQCHKGALEYWEAVRDYVIEDIAAVRKKHGDIPRIVFNGYSMGGLLAQLGATEYANSNSLAGNSRIELITIGSPRVGNHIFTQEAESQIDRVYRAAIQDDPVPAFPFTEDYGNMGVLVQVHSKGHIQSLVHPDGNGFGKLKGNGFVTLPSFSAMGAGFLFAHTPWAVKAALDKLTDSTLKSHYVPLSSVSEGNDLLADCGECMEDQFKIVKVVGKSAQPPTPPGYLKSALNTIKNTASYLYSWVPSFDWGSANGKTDDEEYDGDDSTSDGYDSSDDDDDLWFPLFE